MRTVHERECSGPLDIRICARYIGRLSEAHVQWINAAHVCHAPSLTVVMCGNESIICWCHNIPVAEARKVSEGTCDQRFVHM